MIAKPHTSSAVHHHGEQGTLVSRHSSSVSRHEQLQTPALSKVKPHLTYRTDTIVYAASGRGAIVTNPSLTPPPTPASTSTDPSSTSSAPSDPPTNSHLKVCSPLTLQTHPQCAPELMAQTKSETAPLARRLRHHPCLDRTPGSERERRGCCVDYHEKREGTCRG